MCYTIGMNDDLHAAASVLTFFLLDNDFCVSLARDRAIAPLFPDGIDMIISRMRELLDGADPSFVRSLREKASFYETFLE